MGSCGSIITCCCLGGGVARSKLEARGLKSLNAISEVLPDNYLAQKSSFRDGIPHPFEFMQLGSHFTGYPSFCAYPALEWLDMQTCKHSVKGLALVCRQCLHLLQSPAFFTVQALPPLYSLPADCKPPHFLEPSEVGAAASEDENVDSVMGVCRTARSLLQSGRLPYRVPHFRLQRQVLSSALSERSTFPASCKASI